jgi:hypothetical protein
VVDADMQRIHTQAPSSELPQRRASDAQDTSPDGATPRAPIRLQVGHGASTTGQAQRTFLVGVPNRSAPLFGSYRQRTASSVGGPALRQRRRQVSWSAATEMVAEVVFHDRLDGIPP